MNSIWVFLDKLGILAPELQHKYDIGDFGLINNRDGINRPDVYSQVLGVLEGTENYPNIKTHFRQTPE